MSLSPNEVQHLAPSLVSFTVAGDGDLRYQSPSILLLCSSPATPFSFNSNPVLHTNLFGIQADDSYRPGVSFPPIYTPTADHSHTPLPVE